jgi:energy-coupling factor transporter ATP-binding protein EcfA2
MEKLASLLGSLDLSLAPGADAVERRTARLVGDYLAARSRHPDAPLVVAVVGLSGAGKSTIFNSIAGQVVSAVGSRRPTTIEPAAWADDGVAATLDPMRRRLLGPITDPGRRPPGGVVIVDTPPPDVLGPSGEPIVDEVLDVAEACVVVASAARYADAEGFRIVERARERGMAVIFVVNRLPGDADVAAAIGDDFAAKLGERGLLDPSEAKHLVRVEERNGARPGLLPVDAVAGVTEWLKALGEPTAKRRAIDSTVAASIDIVDASLGVLRRRLLEAEVRRVEMSAPLDHAYSRALDDLMSHVSSGRFLHASSTDDLTAAMAVAAARHAGRAARVAAEHWDGLAHDVVAANPDLFAHAPGTIDAARGAAALWVAATGAATLGDPHRRRRVPRRVRRAWVRAVVHPAGSVPGRRFGRRFPGLASASRRSLREALGAVFDADAARFRHILGSPPPPGVLGSLRLGDRS